MGSVEVASPGRAVVHQNWLPIGPAGLDDAEPPAIRCGHDVLDLIGHDM
jgi:hypothetical protein